MPPTQDPLELLQLSSAIDETYPSMLPLLTDAQKSHSSLQALQAHADAHVCTLYDTEIPRLTQLLESLAISLDSLNKDTAKDLAAIADTMDILDVAFPDAVTCAIADLEINEIRTNNELRNAEQVLKDVDGRYHDSARALEQSERLLAELRADSVIKTEKQEMHAHTTSMLQIKQAEYIERIESLDTRISTDLVTTYASLLSVHQEIQRLEDEIHRGRMELQGFEDLPPDLELARLRLSEKRLELDELVRRKEDVLRGIAEGIS
ncbi:HAUS augmin-like complex subunit 1 [Gaertneriomyces sp. JEL0708]|nr:HAUS augmin-like complex subunit 1 [Gaertneriomyces sp. JEL0708]